MRDHRHYSLSVVVGLLLVANLFVLVYRSTEPDVVEVRAAEASVVQGFRDAAATTTTTAAPQPAAVAVRRPVPVPQPRAAEPIVEIGAIEIPKIGLRHPIFHGITMRNIDRGPSHWPGTALPGETGNTVFAGHRVTRSKPFRNIDQLKPGDHVIFDVKLPGSSTAVRSTYAVTGSEIVTPKELSIVNQTETPTGTLFACHPPGSAKYRYVLRLALLEDPAA